MIIVYTGNGKGKTTASLGQAIRALGEGKKVKKAANINLILTGRNAPKKLIDLADIATEMKEIKYRFTPAKQGIEY